MPDRSPFRDAIRLLHILVIAAERLAQPHESGALGILRGEVKLHAYDFWIRNPDYLAEELLNLYADTGLQRHLEQAETILAADEPDIRRFPMVRWLFGAYERLDDSLALLKSRDLVRVHGTKCGVKVDEWDFLVMPRAYDLAASIEAEFPVLSWYRARAELVHEVAGGRSGSALKHRQYEQRDYAETELGGVIPPITQRVVARIIGLRNVTEIGGDG
jgi:hypothetical protein